MPSEFKNEPLTDFSKTENEKAMKDALAKVSSELGKEYDLIIGGKRKKTQDRIRSVDPSDPKTIIGLAAKATSEDAEEAIKVATETFETWKQVKPETRAEYLFKAAAEMRKRKHEFSAWMVYEVGKSWIEADADTAEAIDFLEFYGREMIRYGGEQPLTRIPTEKNELRYIPLGVGAVIPPWNFPVAILVGMTSAAFVSGNTVLLKPSSDAPVVAAKFMELLEDTGLPAGVVNYVPGSGAQVGDYIVQHPKTRFIAFTGSKEVGLRINEQAAIHREGQIWIKRAILEMGGKDSIVVDKEVDFDAAVKSVVGSAFGFQGQKCSACSRAIILDDIYDKFVRSVVEETAKITQAAPYTSKDVYMGPVVNEAACDKILEYIEIGKTEGELVHGGMRAAGDGYFIQPTIFTEVSPDARISQEEIFGPVLACIRAKDIDDALRIANNTEYGLTGSIYSTNREHLEKAGDVFHVGNLYYNRKCTGALVGVHPFGGFNMSGTDSKAGGRDYLFLFTQAKSISEVI
ncbi:MAG: L-glutamate gamma-semialdehyde dehydrogenase [Candidatus Latescibacterota bacterium]|nr:MAG: L-glutamate gamma-semialdehyde dehydrogenase [Candidatus Latescibacterota bacterium]